MENSAGLWYLKDTHSSLFDVRKNYAFNLPLTKMLSVIKDRKDIQHLFPKTADGVILWQPSRIPRRIPPRDGEPFKI